MGSRQQVTLLYTLTLVIKVSISYVYSFDGIYVISCMYKLEQKYTLNTVNRTQNETRTYLKLADLIVSPSTELQVSMRSSDPSASTFWEFYAPQIILLLCFPNTGT